MRKEKKNERGKERERERERNEQKKSELSNMNKKFEKKSTTNLFIFDSLAFIFFTFSKNKKWICLSFVSMKTSINFCWIKIQ